MSKNPIKQPLPLYRKIIGGFPILDAATAMPLNMSSTRRIMVDAVPFNAQVAADIYWKGEQDWYTFREVGPVKPPYPALWLEWVVPEGTMIGGKEVGKDWLVGIRCGMLVTESEQIRRGNQNVVIDEGNEDPCAHIDTDPDREFDASMFMTTTDGRIKWWPTVLRVVMDDDGMYTRHAWIYDTQAQSRMDAYQMGQSVGMFSVPIFVALGLTNCRNVITPKAGQLVIPRPKRPRNRKEARGPGSIRIDYHTIVLPGGVEHHDGTTSGGGGDMAVHRVRGHFKTYTAEAPLLGKHVGTYWWGWQVRGNPEHGVVVSDYEIGEQE